MSPSMNLPGVFLLDAQAQLAACMDLIPVTSCIRFQVPSQLLLQIALHLLLDNSFPVQVDSTSDEKAQWLCTTVNTFASRDIGQYKYAFTEEIMLNLYQWYFETYMIMLNELNHFFPDFQHYNDGLPYTVKLYDTLLRFDHIPLSRDYAYVMDRTT
jgi:hypothetical protein